ncbi:MAG: VWA domain-containing protein [Natronomonas sp.]
MSETAFEPISAVGRLSAEVPGIDPASAIEVAVLIGFLGPFDSIGFERPLFLLVVPVAVVVTAFLFLYDVGPAAPERRDRYLFFGSRLLVVLLLVTAAAGPYLVDVRETTGEPEVHLLVDDSDSMDVYDVEADRLAESIESEGVPVRTTTIASDDGSPLGDGVLRSLERESHVVLVSDGQVTEGRSLGAAADVAYEQNATISAIELRADRPERVVSVDAPETTIAGVEEQLLVSVDGVGDTVAEVRVTVGTEVSDDRSTMADGEEIHSETLSETDEIEIDHTFEEPGEYLIEAEIDSGGGFEANHEFRRVVRVVEPPEVLYVSRVDYPLESYLGELYDVTRAESVPDREALEAYHAVVVQDLAAGDIGDVGALQSFAADGNGVVVVGGDNSYERGGYDESPIGTMLPVRFEDTIGGDDVVLVVDVSGSAEEEMPQVRGLSLDVLDQISDDSRLGVVAFDTQAQVLSELRPVGEERAELEETIRRMQAGGGTEIESGLIAGGEMLEDGGEIILISDGVDDPAEPIAAAEQLAADDIRVTGVGFGWWRDDDLMTTIAQTTGGTYLTPDETQRLQLLFDDDPDAPDADSLVVVDGTHFVTRGVETEADPAATNDVSPRNGARLLVTTSDGDPAVTSWRFGLGRVASITTYDDDGSIGSLLTGPDAELTTRTTNWAIGDPQRKETNVTEVEDTHRETETTVVHRGETRPESDAVRFTRVDENRFEATVSGDRVGYHEILDATYAVNYHREYAEIGQSPAVEAAVEQTGGQLFRPEETASIAQFTRATATRERVIQDPLTTPLLVAGLLVYLGDVIVRRLREIYDLRGVIPR